VLVHLLLFITEMLKIPVGTTHTIAGSIIGVGAIEESKCSSLGCDLSSLPWALGNPTVIPISALMAGAICRIHFFCEG
jgi:PiT family inorganic phosphate transporter